jgi:hypothetical protein
MAQTVLNFSITSTDERFTSRSGEIIFTEYLKATGLNKLYNIAGKVITHARQTILKVNEQFVELFENIRQKSYDISLE